MATVTVNDSNLYDIADSIRAKLGVQTTYKPSQMADAIDSISGGGITPTGEIEITANGTYNVTNYASAEVDVPQSGITPTGTISITENGTVDVTQYASAEVDVPTGSTPVINPLSVTANGTYTAPSGVDGYSPVTVNVPTGGGGGLELIDTISVSAARGARIDVDPTWFDTYGAVIIVPDLTFSASDWLYLTNDKETGGGYSANTIAGANSQYSAMISNQSGTYRFAWSKGNGHMDGTVSSYLYFYMYTASKTMTGTFKIYGVKNA